MQLIPAIDLRKGEVVRLEQGDDERRTRYARDPVETLDRLASAGVEWVHVVDLDAAFGEAPQRDLISRLTRRGPKIELGGGLRDASAVSWALDEAGCGRVVIGSMVVRDFAGFESLARSFVGRIVPALEVAGEEVRIAGWREAAKISPRELGRQLRGLPCPAVLVTDVARDGLLVGPNLDLSRQVAADSGLPILVSGGVRALSDLELAAAVPEVAGIIVGKALYEGKFTIEEAVGAAGGRGR